MRNEWTEKGGDSATYAVYHFVKGHPPGRAQFTWLRWRMPRTRRKE